MILPIRQSELNAVGYMGNFTDLNWNDRKMVATMVCNSVGRHNDAFLLEINNPNAVRGITYVYDTDFRAGR